MHGYAELNTDYKGRELFLHTIGTCHFFARGGEREGGALVITNKV